MSEITRSQPILETDKNLEAAIEACWTELMSLRQQIDAEQAEISRLQTETHLMLTQLKAMVGI
jgi:hypothetical protein